MPIIHERPTLHDLANLSEGYLPEGRKKELKVWAQKVKWGSNENRKQLANNIFTIITGRDNEE